VRDLRKGRGTFRGLFPRKQVLKERGRNYGSFPALFGIRAGNSRDAEEAFLPRL